MFVKLKVWTPDGEIVISEIEKQDDLLRELRAIGQKFCCRASDLDYQVGDGIRVTGDSGALDRGIDARGLPPLDNENT